MEVLTPQHPNALAQAANVQTPKPGLIEKMAAHFNIQPAQFYHTIKQTIMPDKGNNVTNEQIASFLIVADKYKLNPFTKEIYAFPTKGGGIQPVVGVDGWSTILNREPQFDGLEFEDHRENNKLIAITCRISRKDRTRPIEVTEYMSECVRGTEPWQKWPARMLRHKVMIQCARYAFGLSGIVDPDEAERIAESNLAPNVIGTNQAQVAGDRAAELASKYTQQQPIAAPAQQQADPEPAHLHVTEEQEPRDEDDEPEGERAENSFGFEPIWTAPKGEPVMQAAAPRARRGR